jgi:hypothetical protein
MCLTARLLTWWSCAYQLGLSKKAISRVKSGLSESGSPGGTRTPDQLVNSQLLYRLSYRGITDYFSMCAAPDKSLPPRLVASCSNRFNKAMNRSIN